MSSLRSRFPVLLPAAMFAGTFTVLLVAALVVIDAVPALSAAAAELSADRAGDDDHYLANDLGGQLDHHVLYHGLDRAAVEAMRAADVLFLGNSRLMCALRPEELDQAFDARGLRYYALGFGFREADRFPLEIIRKFDLRPQLVVVNADGFFGHGLSPWAEEVNRDTPFAARKLRWESEIAHDVRRTLYTVAPNWLNLAGRPGLARRRPWNVYRSRRNGTWEIASWEISSKPFVAPALDGVEPSRSERAGAAAFKAEMESRGIRLVVTRVPNPEPMPGARAGTMAALLEVPLVIADPPGLTSADNSHLDEASAHDWSRAFLTALTPYLPAGATRPAR